MTPYGDKYWSGSTLAQVMACCLMAPSHYLNQCWLIICKVQWHLSEGAFTMDTSAMNHLNSPENYLSEISSKLPRGQWVDSTVKLLDMLKVYISLFCFGCHALQAYHITLECTLSEIQNYWLPYGSLGPMGHDPYGSHSTGNGSYHW